MKLDIQRLVIYKNYPGKDDFLASMAKNYLVASGLYLIIVKTLKLPQNQQS